MKLSFKDCSQQIVTCQVAQYEQDIRIDFLERAVSSHTVGIRSAIYEFSRKSQRRFQFFIRNTQHNFRFIMHLTYPNEFPVDVRESQRHLNVFLVWLRRKGGQYVWVKEFQSRGAVHYHICTDTWIPKNELSQKWFNVVGSQDERHLQSGTRVETIKSKDHAAAYMCGYLKKSTQKVVPEGIVNVGRFWGATRGLLKVKSIIVLKKVRLGKVKRAYRVLGKAYSNKLKQWGIKSWSWGNRGFVGWSMSAVYEKLAPNIQFSEV